MMKRILASNPRLHRLLWIKVCLKALVLAACLAGDARAEDCDPPRGDVSREAATLAETIVDIHRAWESEGAPMQTWVRTQAICAGFEAFSFAFRVHADLPVRRYVQFRSDPPFDRRFFARGHFDATGNPRFTMEALHHGHHRLFFGDRIRAETRVDGKKIEVTAMTYGSADDRELPPGARACANEMARLFSELLKGSALRLIDEANFGPNADLSI